jgi:glucosyl-3-phosphoglycerate synthase
VSDFSQTGSIATLHRLVEAKAEPLERQLELFAEQAPLALVLPALYQDFLSPAMEGILRELEGARYVDQFVLALCCPGRDQFREARQRLHSLPGDVRIVWIDGPRITKLFQCLEEQGLYIGPDGKGRSCWMAYGYVLAVGRARVMALHDCDIVNYQRYMLARLCYPVMNPNLPFEFCKGYYARLSDRMHGRVTRLLWTPLVRSLSELCGSIRFLRYIDSFRYALAGEFAMHADLARVNRIPSDWGLEVGVLAEIYRNCSLKRICQVDIADNYEHKHQDLSLGDPSRGLMKMAVDISKAMFHILAAEGVKFDGGTMRTLRINYVRTAEDTIARYGADAMINGLGFDSHEEETAVETFAEAIKLASEDFFANPLGTPPLPNWSRVSSALPTFLDTLKEAVDADNAE